MRTYRYMGREHRVFAFQAYGAFHRCILVEHVYTCNGTLAVQVLEILEDGPDRWLEPWGMLTANVENGEPFHQSGTAAFIKTYSENSGWALAIADEVGTYQGVDAVMGHAVLPLYEIHAEKLYGPGPDQL